MGRLPLGSDDWLRSDRTAVDLRSASAERTTGEIFEYLLGGESAEGGVSRGGRYSLDRSQQSDRALRPRQETRREGREERGETREGA
jgi:hypothetical protein